MLMPIGLNRDSNPGHLVGVPIHAQAANPNAELENTAGISDFNASSWLYKQSMLHVARRLFTSSDAVVHVLHGRCSSLLFKCGNFSWDAVSKDTHEFVSCCAPQVGKSAPVGMATIPISRPNIFYILHTTAFPQGNQCVL